MPQIPMMLIWGSRDRFSDDVFTLPVRAVIFVNHLSLVPFVVFSLLRIYQKAVNVNPLNDYAWNNLGQTYMHFERYGEAINCFDKVLKINPEHGDAKKFKQECLQKI